jgi:glutamate-1-semialdehyde 2,1-aminomutase
VKQAFEDHKDEIAAFIVEPIAGNMGCIPPLDDYLKQVRELCTQAGALLIFDEVMTGFRVAYGGAQQLYGVTPDLTCMGKVIGGGLPCAAYGGRKDLMAMMAPSGPVYQAGTLSGNPLAMAAGLATLEVLKSGEVYKQLEATSDQLLDGLLALATKNKLTTTGQRVGSMLTIFFHPGPIENYGQATASDTESFAVFFRGMLERGVVLPPSQFEAWFVGSTHGEDEIKQTLTAAAGAFADVAAFQKSRKAQ